MNLYFGDLGLQGLIHIPAASSRRLQGNFQGIFDSVDRTGRFPCPLISGAAGRKRRASSPPPPPPHGMWKAIRHDLIKLLNLVPWCQTTVS